MDPVVVHQIAGGGILAFTLLLLARALGRLSGGWSGLLLPIALVTLGLFLIFDNVLFHGGDFGAEGVQHQIQGAVALGIGAIELGRARGWLVQRLWGAILPMGIIAVGIMFVLHDQHGGGDMQLQLVQHRILGATIVFMGAVQGIDNLKLAQGNWAAVGWLLLLVVVCLELFLYVEGGTGSGQGGHEMLKPMEHGGH
jgi:hypothetical protein